MIITLCGSSRFESWFHMWNQALGMSGHVPISMCSYPSLHNGETNPEIALGEEVKRTLDHVHKQKIDISNAILVLNVFGYIGASTASEIYHAGAIGRRIYFLESWGKGFGVGRNHVVTLRKAKEAYGIPEDYVSPMDTSCYPDLYSLLPPAGMTRHSIIQFLEKKEREAYRYRMELNKVPFPYRDGKCTTTRDVYGTIVDCVCPFNHLGGCAFDED